MEIYEEKPEAEFNQLWSKPLLNKIKKEPLQ